MIGAAQLAKMRAGSFIINAARGGLIDEEALVAALESGHLAGAASDVFAIEPDANPKLLALPTFLGTPHIGGSTKRRSWRWAAPRSRASREPSAGHNWPWTGRIRRCEFDHRRGGVHWVAPG
jgi:phosphoglycerate dehydrogenase-like enzyme